MKCYYRNPIPSIERAAKWRKKNHERHNVLRNKSTRKLRPYYKKLAFDHYGNTCACCSENDPLTLQIDHINNDGAAHRGEKEHLKGAYLCQWLVDNNFPPGFQLLCRNCNFGKYKNKGVCPHKSLAYKPSLEELLSGVTDQKEIARIKKNDCQRKINARRKEAVFQHYGKQCACCGYSKMEFLEIDHKNNDGFERRKADKISGGAYLWVVKAGFPDYLQTLCGNCNFAKRMNKGVCYHNKPLVSSDTPKNVICVG